MDCDEIENLYLISDLKREEYEALREQYLSKGQTQKLRNVLMGRSLLPKYRNTQRPPGELYAPVAYTSDYIVKLVEKPAWGGWILTLTCWDMMIIDIDCLQEDPLLDPKYLSILAKMDAEAAEAAGAAEEGAVEDSTEPQEEPQDTSHASQASPREIKPDSEAELAYIEQNIKEYYPNDLFYINKTNRGYHVYLVSRPISHLSTEAIFMRIRLNGDPAHGTNSLYTGPSVRLSRKMTDPPDQRAPSHFLRACGQGTVDPRMQQRYDTIQTYLQRYGSNQIDPSDLSLMKQLQEEWTPHLKRDHGLTHIMTCAPYLLCDNKLIPNDPFALSPSLQRHCMKAWQRTIKYRNLHACCGVEQLVPGIIWAQYNMCYNNLYRILEATEDYAYGVHLQENCHFISYRDLLVIDYDCPKRIQILCRYVRANPWCTFRLVRTTKGYHAFLTSRPIHHRASLEMLLHLRSDPLHVISSFHRGYGVRVNQKLAKERPYRETQTMGSAPEDPRLVTLYLKHLELYQMSCENKVALYNAQFTKSWKILQESK